MVLGIVVSLIFVIVVQQFKLRENLLTKLFFIQKIFFIFNENFDNFTLVTYNINHYNIKNVLNHMINIFISLNKI